MKKVKITQLKSAIDCTLRQKRTLQSIGLRRPHHNVEKEMSQALEGMIRKVAHLVSVEELS